ncbi:hypothetical protein LCGC14_1945510 [marine sediment metagenome]|uniref:Uncharacterized protein n=1 Tax=marine sediment metagenome TaxID=412755 RepID=A0A0F9FJC2_9ZZZZ
MVRSLVRLKKAFGKENGLKAQDFFDLIDTFVNKTILSLVASDVGLGSTSDPTFKDITATSISLTSITLLEQSAPPDDPDPGKAAIYLSDGSESDESAGDLIVLISSPADSTSVTKKKIIVDFSA